MSTSLLRTPKLFASICASIISQLPKISAFLALLLISAWLPAQTSVLTYHYDNSRSGLNSNETILTPANVGSSQFGRLFSQPVDSFVYAQPLYVPHLAIPGKGKHNVVFVATEGDSVYAFDADSNNGANAKPLWHASLIDVNHGAAPGATRRGRGR